MNFQTRFDYPIEIRTSVKSQFFPDCLDEFPSWVWLPNCDLTNVKSQFFPNRLNEFLDRVWLPICESTKCQIPISPWLFGWISKPGLITQLRFDKVSNPNFSPTVWMIFQTGSDYPFAIWQVSNPNFSSTVWMNFQTGSDYPIEIWQVPSLNFSPIVWMNF